MPQFNNLKSVVNAGKSVTGSVSGAIEQVAGAAGKGAFGVNVGKNGISISGNFNELLKKKQVGNLVKSPLKSLYTDLKVKDPIIFPLDLDNEHYIMFKIMKSRRENRTDTKKNDTFQNIVLPVPSNLAVQSGANYSDANLGVFGGMAAGRITGSDVSDAVSSLGDMIATRIEQAGNAMKTVDSDAGVFTMAGQALGPDGATKAIGMFGPAIAAATGAKVAGGLGSLLALGGSAEGVVAGIGLSEGLALNPHLAVVFNNVGFRSHSFTYKFIARNQEESDAIKRIINTFKYHMHPSYDYGTIAFKYPDEFEIEFASAIAPYLYDIGTCVLKDVSVNFNGEGTPIFFEGSGAPVSIEIQLSFQETFIYTKERLEDRYE
jgi:hypothetical protein